MKSYHRTGRNGCGTPEHKGVFCGDQQRSSRRIRPSRLVVNAEGPVAFQAHLSGDMSHIGLHQKIMFDYVSLNVGNAYHSSHGLFIAPRPGIYIFSGSLLAHVTKEIEMAFMKNGAFIGGGILANAVNTNGYDQGSETVVAQLKAGDEVWIENRWPDDTSIRGSQFTCFMGCLIMEL
ncbi:complement C1q-like protein 4 [Mercenaria mercenaria]|uniref:complement C1q-like protein 4 n=1 Tax=Mercenaria mercenaria TaxID=6596 RepID=UPI00234EBCAB|nr:complement C1q-like protein 4 [Mercenaria mercenaria]